MNSLRHTTLVTVLVLLMLTVAPVGPRQAVAAAGPAFDVELVSDIWPGRSRSDPVAFAAFGDGALFIASDNVHGRELWITDGMAAGTHIVRDISGAGYVGPNRQMAVAGGLGFFATKQESLGVELWMTDGTTAGTRMVVDLTPGLYRYSEPSNLTAFGNSVLFSATTDAYGRELWVSDGTTAGTRLVADIKPGGGTPEGDSNPNGFHVMGDQALFAADDGVHGFELWITDGTAAGTQMVVDLLPDPRAMLREFVSFGDNVLYTTTSDQNNTTLRITDGTAEGTVPLYAYRVNRKPYLLLPTVLGDRAFFALEPGLAVTDGTPDGLEVLSSGAWFGQPALLTVAGDRLFFRANAPESGSELWTSDGTAAGTRIVRDISTGHASPSFLTALGDLLVFTANDGVHGTELWVTDGTESGTRMVADILPGAAGSRPEQLTAVGDTLYFNADDGTHGRELWKLRIDEPPYSGTMVDATTLDEIVASDDYNPDVHGDILRLYPAFFGREADVPGARYWLVTVHDQLGFTLSQITRFFANDQQPEFVSAYADISANDHAAYLARVYFNMLGRAPDRAGFAYWLALMDAGVLDRAGVVRWVALNTEFINRYPYRAPGV